MRFPNIFSIVSKIQQNNWNVYFYLDLYFRKFIKLFWWNWKFCATAVFRIKLGGTKMDYKLLDAYNFWKWSWETIWLCDLLNEYLAYLTYDQSLNLNWHKTVHRKFLQAMMSISSLVAFDRMMKTIVSQAWSDIYEAGHMTAP